MNSLQEVKELWKDTEENHKFLNDSFIEKVNAVPELKAHRDFVENNIWGFGERAFLWMWWLIIKEMPHRFSFLEIGVFKGQVLSLIKMIADMQGKEVTRYGVTPLSSEGVGWESNYQQDIETIHDKFNIKKDYIILKGDSTDTRMIYIAEGLSLDILYIDGCHTEECTKSDIVHYSPSIKKDGYLVIDDSGCGFHMPFGYFQGIKSVCDAVDKILPPFTKNDSYEHLFNIVHNRVWKKLTD